MNAKEVLERKFSLATYLATTGAVAGLAGSLFLYGLRLANSPAPQLRAEWLGDLVLLLTYLTPFLLSLFALRKSAAWQSAIWAAAAVLATLGSFSAFSGITLLLLPAALLLTVAAVGAFGKTVPARRPSALLVAAALVLLVAGSWLGLMSGGDDGRCWELIRTATGETTWQPAPYVQQGTVAGATGENEGGITRVVCTGDLITTVEAGLGLLPLVLAALLGTWFARSET